MRQDDVLFRQRAERGTARGAEEVLARARDAASREVDADGSEGWGQVADRVDLTVIDLQGLDDSAAPAPRKRRVVVLAAVATIVVVAGVAVVADLNPDDVATEPVPSAATPDDVLSPSPPDPEPSTEVPESGPAPSVVDSLGYRWSRVPHEEAVFGGVNNQWMNSVTAGGPGLVAVGSARRVAAVWTSVDGLTWFRVRQDEPMFGEEMSGVTAGGPGLVAVGSDFSGAAVWTSVDGLTWIRVPHDEAGFGGANVSMVDVTVGGPGFVAVGFDGDQSAGTAVAAVWTSVDGLSWSRVPHDEAVFGGARNQTMSSVTAGGPGLVAVGSDGDLFGHGDSPEVLTAAVWTSVDGLSWSRVPHDEALFGGSALQLMSSVTAGGPGLVAVGGTIGSDDGGARVWTSADGFSWSRVPHDEVFFGDAAMTSVTATPRGLVVVGDGDVPVVWTSPDGFSWFRAPHDEAIFGGSGDYQSRDHLNRVIAVEAGVVAVGQAPASAAAVWVGVAEN